MKEVKLMFPTSVYLTASIVCARHYSRYQGYDRKKNILFSGSIDLNEERWMRKKYT